jgi:DNA-binding NarL/FixJ family response regulator
MFVRSLQSMDDVSVAYVASSLQDAIDHFQDYEFDVALIGGVSGMYTANIGAQCLDPDTIRNNKRVVLSRGITTALLVQAADGGFDDVIDLNQPTPQVVEHMRACVAGERNLRHHPLWRDVDLLVDTHSTSITYHDDLDRQIVAMIAVGQSNQEIADCVFLSNQTVRNRISRILEDSGIKNRTQLAAIYLRDQYALGFDHSGEKPAESRPEENQSASLPETAA